MERWYWVELIGFDNESEDYGVSEYLSRNQSTDGVSLLFAHIDFIFEQDREELSKNACSYFGHEYNSERRRQNWTKTQLRGLVRALQAHGVKVFFSCFDMTASISDPTWLCYGRTDKPRKSVYVIKALENGTVGDEVIDKMRAVLEDYGFDGLHLADGLSSARISIENGDFSVPFCRQSGVNIPKKLMRDGDEAYAERREWILKNRRFEWTSFLADAWSEFYEKLATRIDKPIIFNNAWTCGPFEALYRYGIDYKRCINDKCLAVMIEENSATRAITAPEDEGSVEFPLSHRDRFAYKYALMQQEIKLRTNGKKQISLMPVKDTMEQWDALRHCPTELIRATVRRYNNFVWQNGQFTPCADAPIYCLADGIAAEDWAWIAKQEGYRLPPVDLADGFVGVYNGEALYAELEGFCKKRRYFGAALTEELLCAGLNMGSQIALCDVSSFDRAKCLLVTNLCVYSAEQKELLSNARIPILAVGEDVDLPIKASSRYDGKYLSVALYGSQSEIDFSILAPLERSLRRSPAKHGEIWTEELSYRRVAPEFFTALSRLLNEAFMLDSSAPDVKIASYICGGEKYALLSNDRHTYYLPTVKTYGEIRSASALMKDKGYTVKCNGNSFTVRIPPRCVEIVKIEQ